MANSTGIVSLPYVSAISSYLVQREIFKDIVDIQLDDEYYEFFSSTGRMQEYVPDRSQSVAPIYRSFYDNPLKTLIDTTGATITGSGTTALTVTGLPANSQNILVVGDLIRTPAGQAARVQTVSGNPSGAFTAQSVNATVLTVVAGNKLSVFSNAQEEGSDGPTPKRWDLGELSNVIQIFRKATQITDVQQNTGIEVMVNGQPSFLSFEMIRALQDHKADISLAMLLGNLGGTLFSDSSPTLSGVNGRGVQTTRGLDEYTTTYGINDSVTTPGTYTLSDLADLASQFRAARAPMDYMTIGNGDAVTVLQNMLLGLPGAGSMTTVRLNRDAANDSNLDFNVAKFSYSGFNWHLKPMKIFDNTSVINYVASSSTKPSVARSLYFLPMGKTPSIGGAPTDYVRMRYMAAQSGPGGTSNGVISEIMTGGLAPVPTSDQMTLKVTYNSNAGLEILAPQKFGKQVVL